MHEEPDLGELDALIDAAIQEQTVDMTRTPYWPSYDYSADVRRTLREIDRDTRQYPNE